MTVIPHPVIQRKADADRKAFAEAWTRYMKCRAQADAVRDMALAGMLALNFTDEEIGLFSHLISEHEHSILRRSRRANEQTGVLSEPWTRKDKP